MTIFNNILDNNIILFSILGNIAEIMSMFLFSLSLTLFYLDDFKLSEVKFLKIIQIFSFVCIPIYLLCNLYNESNICLSDIVSYATDNKDDKNINLHGHVSVTAEAGKAIGQGLQTIGSNIGLGGTIAGVATAVGKAVTKSGMPPVQKAGLIISSGIAAGVAHSVISSANKSAVTAENTTTSAESSTNIGSQVQKLISDSHISPLQELLSSGELMNYVCLSILYLLVIQLIFKLYFKDKINLNLSKLLGDNMNTKIEFYLNKIIIMNKQMSVMWIWYGFVTIMFGLSVSAYGLHKVYANIDNFINGYISFNPNIINNISFTHMYNKSIIDIILNLGIINFISLFANISLMGLLLAKFHFNKNVNNIYIWLIVLILILTLALSAYMLNDLNTNINNYVNIYLNFKNN